MCICVQCPQQPEEGVRSPLNRASGPPGAGVKSSYKQPYMGAGNPTLILCKGSRGHHSTPGVFVLREKAQSTCS